MFEHIGRNEWNLSGVVESNGRRGNSCTLYPVEWGNKMPGESANSILSGLSSSRAGIAWKSFLKIYTPLIMRVILQYENDRQRANDCFLFVCEKLSDDGFHRLLQFDASRNTRFRTWLGLVVSNLCVDWRRKEYGRQRPYRAIAQLSKFDQLVYHYQVECGMNQQSCLRALQLTYPDITENQLAASLGRLHTALNPRQRWQLSIRKHETGSAVFVDGATDKTVNVEPVEKGPGPETVAKLQQAREALRLAMSKLSKQQRLLLRLRYQEDLPLKEVARLAGLGDLHQAKRRIKTALEDLAESLDSDLLSD